MLGNDSNRSIFYLSANIKIRIYKTIILHVFLYGSVIIREEHTLRVFGTSVLRMFGSERVRCEEAEKNCVISSIVNCTLRQILLNDEVKENGNGRACSTRGKKMNA
jgi:hypothetical protein